MAARPALRLHAAHCTEEHCRLRRSREPAAPSQCADGRSYCYRHPLGLPIVGCRLLVQHFSIAGCLRLVCCLPICARSSPARALHKRTVNQPSGKYHVTIEMIQVGGSRLGACWVARAMRRAQPWHCRLGGAQRGSHAQPPAAAAPPPHTALLSLAAAHTQRRCLKLPRDQPHAASGAPVPRVALRSF